MISGNGKLNLLGNGAYKTEFDATNSGTISFETPNSSFEAKGDFTTSGTLQLSITGAGVSTVKVGGDAKVGGVIAPTFSGVAPGYGDSFHL